jgi:hypothetical protein
MPPEAQAVPVTLATVKMGKFALYEYGRSSKTIPGFIPDVIANAFKNK